jgi:hypothetical protein
MSDTPQTEPPAAETEAPAEPGPEVPNVTAAVAPPVGSPVVDETGVNADTPLVNDGSATDQPRSTEEILADAPPLVLPDGHSLVKQCSNCGLSIEDAPPGADCPNCGTKLP